MATMSKTMLIAAVLLSAATLLLGCGGSSGGPSIDEQLKKAEALTNPESRANALVRVAFQQREAKDNSGAEKTLGLARNACKEIESDARRAAILNSIVEGLIQIGREVAAGDLMNEVRSAASKVEEKETKVNLYAKMAETYGTLLDKSETAKRYLGEAEQWAGEAESAEGRVRALLAIAHAYHRLAAAGDAQRLTDAAVTFARGIEDAHQRTNALVEAAARLGTMEKSDEAKTLFGEAEKAADTIAEHHGRGFALVNLADKLRAAGQKAAASSALDKARSSMEQVKDPTLQTELRVKVEQLARKL